MVILFLFRVCAFVCVFNSLVLVGGAGGTWDAVEAWTLAVSKDDKLLASGTQKGSVNLWALDGHKKASFA